MAGVIQFPSSLTASTSTTGSIVFNGGTSNSFSAWQELIASASGTVVSLTVSGTMSATNALQRKLALQLGFGAAGSEIIVGTARGYTGGTSWDSFSYVVPLDRRFAAGTRFAVRGTNEDSADVPVITAAYNIGMA